MKRKQVLSMMLILSMSLSLVTGCSKTPANNTQATQSGQNGENPNGSGKPEAPVTEAPATEAPTTEEPTTEEPEPELTGVSFDEEKINDCIKKTAVIDWQLKADDKYVNCNFLATLGSSVILTLELTDSPLSDSEPEASEQEKKAEKYLAIWDTANNKITKKVKIENTYGDINFYEVRNNQVFHCNGSFADSSYSNMHYTVYDENLELVREFENPRYGSGIFSADGSLYYYAEDNMVYSMTTDGKATISKPAFTQPFIAISIEGIYQNEAGGDNLILTGRLADLKSYRLIADTTSGDIIFASSQYASDSIYWNSMDNALIGSEYGDTFKEYLEYDGKSLLLDYPQGLYTDCRVLEDYMVFTTQNFDSKTDKMFLEFYVYEKASDSFIGTARLDDADASLTDCNMGPDGKSLIFTMWDYGKTRNWYELDLEKLSTPETADYSIAYPEVKPYDMGNGCLDQVEELYDFNEFLPSECEENLLDLKERADAMSEKYGLSIYISNEARMIHNEYAVSACNDREIIEEMLDALDAELSKYPEGFLKQVKWNNVTGVDLYLSGTIRGIEGDVLSYAGGFQSEGTDRDIIVQDISNGAVSIDTFHHELMHAIDNKLMNADSEENRLLDYEWMTLNPDNFSYSYSYSEYDNGTMADPMKYTWWGEQNAKNVYFIDSYAKTYPTEDRARIFEHLMMDDENQWIPISNCPHLMAKVNKMCDLIRKNFDTTGWEDVRWERFTKTSGE